MLTDDRVRTIRPKMKRPILTIFTLILTAGLGCFIFEMADFANGVRQDTIKNLKWQQDNTQIYFVKLPSRLDTMEIKASITLDINKRIHKIKFPNFGTETNVFIYDSTYLKTIQSNTLPKIKPLTKGNFTHDQEVLLDITSLQRGQYYVHYLSCGLGIIIPMIIK
jgi:hypothetical protein